MPSLDSLEARSLLAKGALQTVGTDSAVALRIRNKNGTGTGATVVVTAATNIVLTDSNSVVTTSTFATDTTMAAVAATINASASWECIVLDCLGSLASDNNLVDGSITAADVDGVTYFDALVDSSVALQLSVALAPSRHTPGVVGLLPLNHRAHVQEVRYSVNMGTAAADSAQLWKVSSSGVETKVFGKLSVDTTDTTITWASGMGKITGDDGGKLIFLVKDAATLADATTNYVQLTGLLE